VAAPSLLIKGVRFDVPDEESNTPVQKFPVFTVKGKPPIRNSFALPPEIVM